MNKLAENQGLKFSLFTAVLLSLFASNAFANRPSMANESTEVSSTEVTNEAEPVVVEHRPEAPVAPAVTQPEEPSAVGIMMQQQQQQSRRTVQTGDVIHLPATELHPGETLRIQLLDYPRRGMSMDKVQNEYGQPITTSESVGNPPITHWTYSDRVVYFEYSTVLHVVAR